MLFGSLCIISCFPHPDGGIGRRTSFRYWRVTPWRFESSSGHQFRWISPYSVASTRRDTREDPLSKLLDSLKKAARARSEAAGSDTPKGAATGLLQQALERAAAQKAATAKPSSPSPGGEG